ncbi:MAG: glucose-1-phosphate thymidylyltransferase [Saprospiraceae bacterium]|nr:glucose-1-phosphate thymidylyltransferase [Saprospiraceae bacterium]
MHIILFDTDVRDALLPLTYTRPVCELRVGVLTIREKWEKMLGTLSSSFITTEYLEPLFPIAIHDDNFLINGSVLPSQGFVDVIRTLNSGEALMLAGELMAARLSKDSFEKLLIKQDLDELVGYEIEPHLIQMLDSLTVMTELSRDQIAFDIRLLGEADQVPDGLEIPGDYPIFIDPDARIERALINASDGPVYIGPQAHIMDGATLRGPVSIGAGTIIKSHTFLSKGVCIGPSCEVAGEVKQSVILGYSNKSHEGYLGDSVIGEWCNLGALTSNSNLRNTFTPVKMWNYSTGAMEVTQKNKCGFFMGDYSRTSILTKINSGTVVGVSCHLYGEEVMSSFIPSFSWGNSSNPTEYHLDKALEAIAIFRSFKGASTSDEIRELLTRIFKLTDIYRSKHNA